jgi:hypothetical protein
MRVMMLFWHLPHEEQSVEHVAAPQHEAATDITCGVLARFRRRGRRGRLAVLMLGTASSGRERRAPMMRCVVVGCESGG